MTVVQKRQARSEAQGEEMVPVRVIEVEMGHALPTLSAYDEKKEQRYPRARCLVRLHTQPLGLIDLYFKEETLDPGTYAPLIWQELSTQINAHLRHDGLTQLRELTSAGVPTVATPQCIEEREQFLVNAPFVSVIVPTHDRPEQLQACLYALLSVHYPQYEIIVVDNAPATDVTSRLVEQLAQNAPHLRYVREDRQGPSWARNCGIALAKGDILAFTDDDVVVDRYWLAELVRRFGEREGIVCTTGLVLPQELETSAQLLFEEVGSYKKGFSQHIFAFNENELKRPLHPYVADRFGTGASMAFTANFIRSIGGFDPALGRVGPVRCSQDIAVFFQVLARGYQLAYEPASLAYHLHRRDYRHLRKHIYNHAVGYTAYLTKSLCENPRLLADFALKLPYAFFCTLRARFEPDKLQLPPAYQRMHRELNHLRRKGLLYGPVAYVRSRWQVRKLNRSQELCASPFSSE